MVCKYIIINKLSLKHFSFLTFFIISFMKIIIRNYIDENKHLYQRLFNIYIYSISDLFAFLPCLVIRKRKESNRSKIYANFTSQKTDYSKKISDYIHYDKENISKRSLIPRILLISIFDLGAQISNFFFYLFKGKNEREVAKSNLNILLIFKIISTYLLSLILLKTNFFRHHIISFAINIFFLIILGIFDAIEIININEKRKKIFDLIIYILIKILSTLCYSVENVYGKMILLKNFITPYNILLFRGILELILLVLLSIPLIFIEVNDIDGKNIIFIQFWKSINSGMVIKAILLMLINFFYNVNIWIIIDYFTPNHLSMANIFEYFGFSIYNLIDIYFLGNKKNSQKNIFIFLAIYLFLLIGAFIHNEFIILNFCKLNEKTKVFLDQEALKDLLSTKENIDQSLMNDYDDDDDNSQLLEMEKNEK